jgi:MtfA peptidase
VTIAVHAALLILGLDHRFYKNVSAIVVHPSTVVLKGPRASVVSGAVTDVPMPILGQASPYGPVTIVWDAARNEARHPELGHNVIYHEFAHKLDMLDGTIDGMPPMATPEEARVWIDVCTREYEALSDGTGGDLLRSYGAVSPGEFFAVATEVFFDRPVEMRRVKPELYSVLRSFYRQDPAGRAVAD